MFWRGRMKALLWWALVLAVGIGLCMGIGEAKGQGEATKRPRVAALMGWIAGARDDAAMGVIGGPVAGRGWVGGEQAKGLMHKGDRVEVYGLQSGRVGSAVLTNDGTLSSTARSSAPLAEGLRYAAQLHLVRSAEMAQRRDELSAVWHAPGSPEPRWVRATVLDPASRTYHKVAADWLVRRGVAKRQAEQVTVEQVVRADANADGRDEVFLSIHWPDIVRPDSAVSDEAQIVPPPGNGDFSYLLMRYLPRGSGRPETVVMAGPQWETHKVTGLCDLDGDGWAEVTTEVTVYEGTAKRLYHWTGHGFGTVEGEVWGA